MKTFRNLTVFFFALTSMIALLHTAPASAMGRSGAITSTAKSSTQTTERQGQMETEMQAQIETLRKEMAELKAQVAMTQGATAMK
jgi:TolA-binding protein